MRIPHHSRLCRGRWRRRLRLRARAVKLMQRLVRMAVCATRWIRHKSDHGLVSLRVRKGGGKLIWSRRECKRCDEANCYEESAGSPGGDKARGAARSVASAIFESVMTWSVYSGQFTNSYPNQWNPYRIIPLLLIHTPREYDSIKCHSAEI